MNRSARFSHRRASEAESDAVVRLARTSSRTISSRVTQSSPPRAYAARILSILPEISDLTMASAEPSRSMNGRTAAAAVRKDAAVILWAPSAAPTPSTPEKSVGTDEKKVCSSAARIGSPFEASAASPAAPPSSARGLSGWLGDTVAADAANGRVPGSAIVAADGGAGAAAATAAASPMDNSCNTCRARRRASSAAAALLTSPRRAAASNSDATASSSRRIPSMRWATAVSGGPALPRRGLPGRVGSVLSPRDLALAIASTHFCRCARELALR
mmetsp:Transcript_3618/g.8994  ORF Transcript_3618/g.8994 Transcript_3618/m.8994 type:complete len:273 (+) Transcript_3618:355-1173(+)